MIRALRFLLPLLAGAVSALGFAPLEWWPLTFAGVALLFWAIERSASVHSAAAAGWCFGVGQFTVGLFWIATAFTYQAAMPAFMGVVTVVLLSMFLALYPALAAGLARAWPRAGASRVLVFAATWMLSEWLRGHVLSGFAWNPLGAAWLAAGAVAQAAAWVGALGLSGLMVVAGSGLAIVRKPFAVAAAFAVICGVALLTRFALPAPAPAPATGPLVHLIQPDIGQDTKYDDPAAHIEKYLALSRTALGSPPHLQSIVVWSESSVQDLVEEDVGARARLASLLSPGDLLLFGGVAVIRNPDGSAAAETNSLYALDSSARLLGRYDKSHLVPLGEYVPARTLMTWLGVARLAPGAIDFLPGPGPRTLELPGFPAAGIQICYEVIFPAAVVDEGHRPAWIVNISNDAWFGAWGPPQHLAQARLRAIEEGLPILRGTTTGISAAIDANGVVRQTVPQHRAARMDGFVPRAKPPTLFAQTGNMLPLGWAIVLLGLSAIALRRRPR